MQKCEVNGDNALPSYKWLRNKSYIKGEPITWNFAKFLLDSNGKVFMYYSPKWHPDEIAPHIDHLLKIGKK